MVTKLIRKSNRYRRDGCNQEKLISTWRVTLIMRTTKTIKTMMSARKIIKSIMTK